MNGVDSAAFVMQGDKIGEAQTVVADGRQLFIKGCFAAYLLGSCSFSTQQTKTLNHPKEQFMSQRCWVHTEVL
jgi:hypothetical protein